MLKLSYPILAKDFDPVKDCLLDKILTSPKDTLQSLTPYHDNENTVRTTILSTFPDFLTSPWQKDRLARHAVITVQKHCESDS
jgi:hypothetical protein